MSAFGVIVATRGFFPHSLAEKGRVEIIEKLKKMGHEPVIMSETETRYGAVETHSDAKKYAEFFNKNKAKIDGIIVILPNFGDELGVVETIALANLDVPVLVQACDDDLDKMDLANRRDAFCGKLSVCNNLKQYNIKYTDTTYHTCAIGSETFTKDIEFFAKVCRVVRGLKNARLGAIGARPAAFQTVRFSEKILQSAGITTVVVDMSDIIFAALKLENTKEVMDRVAELKAYGKIPATINEENIIKQAKLGLVMDKWIKDNECDAAAVECWDSVQKNFGCATCVSMSLMGEKGIQCACEMDVMGALTMYALYLASNEPSGYLDWNNNFADDRNKCICLHCSNFPKSFINNDFEISNLDVLGASLGEEKCFGACKANISKGEMTYAKVSTDDTTGKIKVYVGEGNFTDDKVVTAGGVAVCEVPNLQDLMKYVCANGFEHHVAMNRSKSADVIEEALGKYMGWDVYKHS
jgi:L-fucose isomerase-like protein